MNKHYDSNYLNKSAEITKSIKDYSYTFFSKIKNGIIIDLGCGNGLDINELNTIGGGENTLIGIDHDPNMISVAENNKKSSTIKFICAESNNIPLGNDSVDGIRTERLIQHLENQNDTFEEMHRVLKKGSPIVILETDWNGINFYTEHIIIEKKIQNYLVNNKINNGLASRKILKNLNLLNFNEINMENFSITLNSLDEANNLFKIEEILNEMTLQNLLSIKEKKRFLSSLNNLNNMACFRCSIDLILFSAHK